MSRPEITGHQNSFAENEVDSENTTLEDTRHQLNKAESLYNEGTKLIESASPQEDEKRVATLVTQEESRLEAEAQKEKEEEFEKMIHTFYEVELADRVKMLDSQTNFGSSINEYMSKGLFRELKDNRAWRLSADERGIDLTGKDEEANKGLFGHIPHVDDRNYVNSVVFYCKGFYFEGEIDMDMIERSFKKAGEYLDKIIKK